MPEIKYELSWETHAKSICTSLKEVQERGELVDMTLAADGYHVKAHKLILSLVSPYIKALISSADCPHPVVFLHQISHDTLKSILEYVYTGVVLVAQSNIKKFMEACRTLQIKGLNKLILPSDCSNLETIDPRHHIVNPHTSGSNDDNTLIIDDSDVDIVQPDMEQPNDDMQHDLTQCDLATQPNNPMQPGNIKEPDSIPVRICSAGTPSVQFSVTSHGNLQLILNGFIYNTKYWSRTTGHRTWRCNYFRKKKCPAQILTSSELVLARSGLHNHPRQDKEILKKIQKGAIFTALVEAESKIIDFRKKEGKT